MRSRLIERTGGAARVFSAAAGTGKGVAAGAALSVGGNRGLLWSSDRTAAGAAHSVGGN